MLYRIDSYAEYFITQAECEKHSAKYCKILSVPHNMVMDRIVLCNCNFKCVCEHKVPTGMTVEDKAFIFHNPFDDLRWHFLSRLEKTQGDYFTA